MTSLLFILSIFADYHKPNNFHKGLYFILFVLAGFLLAILLIKFLGIWVYFAPPILIFSFCTYQSMQRNDAKS